MGDAGRLEWSERERSHLDRMIDQLIVIGGAIDAEAFCRRVPSAQGRRYAPGTCARASRGQDLHLAGMIVPAERSQEEASAVEKSAPRVQVGSTDREIVCVHIH